MYGVNFYAQNYKQIFLYSRSLTFPKQFDHNFEHHVRDFSQTVIFLNFLVISECSCNFQTTELPTKDENLLTNSKYHLN